MSSLQCPHASRKALCRVFASPLELREASLQQQRLGLLHSRATQASGVSLGQRRSYAFVPRPRNSRDRGPEGSQESGDRDRREFQRFMTLQDYKKTEKARLPQDFEITDPKIMVINNGNLEGPILTKHALARLNEGESLRMFQAYTPARPKDNIPESFAMCKVVNKKEEYQRQREMAERRRVSRMTTTKQKELEVNWGISDNDLDTKLKQLDGFLNKGMKVTLMFGKKKRGKEVPAAEMEALADRVRKWVADRGVKEYKPREGSVGRTMRMYLEGVRKQA